MLSLFNPTVILGLIIALIGSFGWGHHQAYLEQQVEIGRLNTVMAEEANKSAAIFQKEKQNAQIKINQLRADVNSGAIRLSIPVNSSCSTPLGTTETRAELDNQTSQDLISIAEDGDNAIRDLNYCIDRYNQIKDTK
jgi:hypothetical protein